MVASFAFNRSEAPRGKADDAKSFQSPCESATWQLLQVAILYIILHNKNYAKILYALANQQFILYLSLA